MNRTTPTQVFSAGDESSYSACEDMETETTSNSCLTQLSLQIENHVKMKAFTLVPVSSGKDSRIKYVSSGEQGIQLVLDVNRDVSAADAPVSAQECHDDSSDIKVDRKPSKKVSALISQFSRAVVRVPSEKFVDSKIPAKKMKIDSDNRITTVSEEMKSSSESSSTTENSMVNSDIEDTRVASAIALTSDSNSKTEKSVVNIDIKDRRHPHAIALTLDMQKGLLQMDRSASSINPKVSETSAYIQMASDTNKPPSLKIKPAIAPRTGKSTKETNPSNQLRTMDYLPAANSLNIRSDSFVKKMAKNLNILSEEEFPRQNDKFKYQPLQNENNDYVEKQKYHLRRPNLLQNIGGNSKGSENRAVLLAIKKGREIISENLENAEMFPPGQHETIIIPKVIKEDTHVEKSDSNEADLLLSIPKDLCKLQPSAHNLLAANSESCPTSNSESYQLSSKNSDVFDNTSVSQMSYKKNARPVNMGRKSLLIRCDAMESAGPHSSCATKPSTRKESSNAMMRPIQENTATHLCSNKNAGIAQHSQEHTIDDVVVNHHSTAGDGEILAGGAQVKTESCQATARINDALKTLKTELMAMREQDILLLKQLININQAIQKLQRSRVLKVSKSLSFSSSYLLHQKPLHRRYRPLERQNSAPQTVDRRRLLFSSIRQSTEEEMGDSLSSFDESEFDSQSEGSTMSLNNTAGPSSPYLTSPKSPRSPRSPRSPLSNPRTSTVGSSLDVSEDPNQTYEDILRRNIRLWKMSSQRQQSVIEEVTCIL